MTYVTIGNVYKYTMKNGKLFVHEGDVYMTGKVKRVYFKDIKQRACYPPEDVFGVVHYNGPSLWLTERNDDLAKRIFIAFEEKGLELLQMSLQKQINAKKELIRILKGES